MAKRLRIATFNVESLDDRPDLEPPLSERIAVLRPQLLRLDADILCLQEVNAQRPAGGGPRRLLALDRLLATTPYAGFHRAAAGKAGGGALADVHNLVLLSRHAIAEVSEPRHQIVPPLDYRPLTAIPPAQHSAPVEWDRPLLVARVTLPGDRTLHLINLHLRAPLAAPIPGQKEDAFTWKSVAGWAEGFYLATLKRSGQALEARLLVERIFDREPDALVAVVGDFNAEERETPLRIVRGDVEDTGNGLLARRSLVPLARSLPETQRFSVVHQGRRSLLDHVLVSRGLLALYRHVEVHNETLTDEMLAFAAVRHGTESLHAPLVAEFALPGEPD